MKLPIEFRTPNAGDESFIYNAWLKSYKDSPCGKTMVSDVFFSNHKLIVSSLLGDDSVDILLAVNPDNPAQIYGFACLEKTPAVSTIHYVYVKYNFRKLGIAAALVAQLEPNPDNIKFFTHLPREWREVVTKYDVVYNPYLLETRKGK